mgnify:FL=1
MKLSDLIEEISFYVKSIQNKEINDLIINDIKSHHEHITKGDLFICLSGFTFDGHQFAQKAEALGAVAIFAEREVDVSIPVIILSSTKLALAKIACHFYEYPSANLSLFGITGTNGKTTIAYLLNDIFTKHNERTGMIGTIETKIGNQRIPNSLTTPDVLTIQKTLAKMVEAKVTTVFMEVSSHALALGRVHGCDFDVAIFSNLTQDHLDFHESMTDYLYVKSLLFSQLGNKYQRKRKKFAIINRDDKHYPFLSTTTAQHILTYSCEREADFAAKDIDLSVKETRFTLCTPKGEVRIFTPLIGQFNVSNMLAAAAAAVVKGVPLNIIKQALENPSTIQGRFEVLETNTDFAIIVDYAHTPDSLKKVLQTLKSLSKGDLYVVVGCGGDRDRAKRPLMAKAAVNYATKAIFTSDNPRSEEPLSIIEDMTKQLTETNYIVEIDRKKAIDLAVKLAKENDIILIAGKGHETYQEIKGIKYDFDDRLVAKEAVEKKEN